MPWGQLNVPSWAPPRLSRPFWFKFHLSQCRYQRKGNSSAASLQVPLLPGHSPAALRGFVAARGELSTCRDGSSPSPCPQACIQMCCHSWGRCERCRAPALDRGGTAVPVPPLGPFAEDKSWEASHFSTCEGTSFPPSRFPCTKIHPLKYPRPSLQLRTGDTAGGKVLEAAGQEECRISLPSCGFELQAAPLVLRNALQLWFRACLKQAADTQRILPAGFGIWLPWKVWLGFVHPLQHSGTLPPAALMVQRFFFPCQFIYKLSLQLQRFLGGFFLLADV